MNTQSLLGAALGAYIMRNTGTAGMMVGAMVVGYVASQHAKTKLADGPPPMQTEDTPPLDPEPEVVDDVQPSRPGRYIETSKGRIFIPDHR